jgi:methylenetetrahydrofolate reductase (NADPH)
MNLATNASNTHERADDVVELARAASTEISTHDEELLPALANKLPAGMAVYVAHTPKASLEDVVRVALKAQSLGFRASPHIVARRLASARALKDALRDLRDGGVAQVLLIAGDLERPVGNFTSTLEVLDTGLLEASGIKRVGVAGHPEGHKSIGAAALLTALRHKQEFARRTGIETHIVTQFGFNPEGVCAWDRHLTQEGITLPVHVGIAGPTPLPKLIKFALQCGVGASMHSLLKNMGAMANLARLATTPDEMLLGLIRGRAAYRGSRLVQPHFYAFGGTMATATWLGAVADGSFTVDPEGRKFVMRA